MLNQIPSHARGLRKLGFIGIGGIWFVDGAAAEQQPRVRFLWSPQTAGFRRRLLRAGARGDDDGIIREGLNNNDDNNVR